MWTCAKHIQKVGDAHLQSKGTNISPICRKIFWALLLNALIRMEVSNLTDEFNSQFTIDQIRHIHFQTVICVETMNDLSAHLNVRNLIFTNRNEQILFLFTVHHDIGSLQDR